MASKILGHRFNEDKIILTIACSKEKLVSMKEF
jgi:hypothetical protein